MPDMRHTSPNWVTPVREPMSRAEGQDALYEAPREEMIAFIEARRWHRIGKTEFWKSRRAEERILRTAYTIQKMLDAEGYKR